MAELLPPCRHCKSRHTRVRVKVVSHKYLIYEESGTVGVSFDTQEEEAATVGSDVFCAGCGASRVDLEHDYVEWVVIPRSLKATAAQAGEACSSPS